MTPIIPFEALQRYFSDSEWTWLTEEAGRLLKNGGVR
jgi:hypothetical protein